jgi:hypothetical protein
MKKSFFCFSGLLAWLISGTAFSQVLTGSGTSASPYLIYTYAQLDSVRNHLSSHFRLKADIDASSSITDNSGAGFVPIGSSASATTYFRGYFHGGGHIINNLHINRPSSSGIALFGAILTNAVIDSLGISNATIQGTSTTSILVAHNCYATVKNCYATGSVTGTGDQIGGLVAYNEAGSINSCYFIGSVAGTGSSSQRIGGITGENYGTIKNSYAKGTVTGYKVVGGLNGLSSGSVIDNCFFNGKVIANYTTYNYTGGLVGESLSSKIINSYAMGSVKGGQATGGLIGWSSGDSISYCFTTNSVTSTKDDIGGLIGYTYNKSIISYSYSTGSITSTGSGLGGLIGTNVSIVKNCYSTADVIGNIDVGGMNGYNSGKLYYSYSTGLVQGQKLASGGLVSYNITASGCYWNLSTSGQNNGYAYKSTTNITSIVGLTTTEMKNPANLDSLDFITTWKIRDDSTYAGLQNIDNAPFAFADVITEAKSVLSTGVPATSLLANDYDIETRQHSLVLQIDSISGGTFHAQTNTLYFPDTANTGDLITVIYRVGEVRTAKNDTLWGNHAQSILVLADLSEILDTTNEDTPITIDLASVGSIYNGAITYSVVKPPVNGKVIVSNERLVYTPNENFYGLDSLRFVVSNEIRSDTGWVKITVIPEKETPVITWAAPESFSYGTALSSIQLNATATYNGLVVDGLFVYSPSSGYVLNAGDAQILNLTFTPANTADYVATTATVNINVSKAMLTVTANSQSISYGDAIPALTIHYTGFVNGDKETGLGIEPTVSTTATSSSAAGTYDIIVSGGSDNNYNFTYVKGTLTISPVTSVKEVTGSNAGLYPNPCTDGFTVNAGDKATTLYIYDLSGKLIFTRQVIGLSRVNVGNMDNGVYVVKVNGMNIKLIKNE